MKRVLVIGCSAAGKSTLARDLGRRIGVPVIHLDRILWKPGCKLTPPEKEAEAVAPLLEKSEWVIDGNYTASLPQRLAVADTIVFVDFSRPRCLICAMQRLVKHRGTQRPDMGGGCEEKLDLGFLGWIWRYPHEERPTLLTQIREHGRHALLVQLRTQAEIDQWLESIPEMKKEEPNAVGAN